MLARHAAITLFCGSYLLGVATSLVLVEFNEYPDNWKLTTTLVVAAIAVIALVTSVYFIRTSDNAPNVDISSGSAVPTAGERSAPSAIQSASNTGDRVDRDGQVSDPIEPARDSETVDNAQPSPVVDRNSSPQGHEPSGPGHRADGDEQRPLPPEPTTPKKSPPPAQEPQADDLKRVWNTYRREGDGHFNAQGLQKQFHDLHFDATVSASNHVGARDCVLVVETRSRKPDFFVLPSFARSPRAVGKWFEDNSGGALTGRIEQVLVVAEGRRTETEVQMIRKGIVA